MDTSKRSMAMGTRLVLVTLMAGLLSGQRDCENRPPTYCAGDPCNDGNACTVDRCDPRNFGQCTYTNAADGTSCDGGNGICQSGDCQAIDYCAGDPCDDGNVCTVDHCDSGSYGQCTYANAADGTSCDGGNGICQSGDCQAVGLPCSGTPGSGLPDDPELCTKTITVAFNNNIAPEDLLFPYRLTVVPDSPIVANQPFTASVGGAVGFPEYFFDWFQSFFPLGFVVEEIFIVDLVATVQTRGGGATEADVGSAGVALRLDPSIPFECVVTREACDPTNDLPGVPGLRGNTDCSFVDYQNPCARIINVPLSFDCAPGGICESLGKQCLSRDFCVTGGLELPLETVVATYTGGDGVTPGQTEALFGFADDPPPPGAVGDPPLDPDGTWNMLSGVLYTGIPGELGFAFILPGIGFAFEGVMAVDSNGPYGVGVPGDFSPTPDVALLSFPVQVP